MQHRPSFLPLLTPASCKEGGYIVYSCSKSRIPWNVKYKVITLWQIQWTQGVFVGHLDCCAMRSCRSEWHYAALHLTPDSISGLMGQGNRCRRAWRWQVFVVEVLLLKCSNHMRRWETIRVVIHVDIVDKAILHAVMAFRHHLWQLKCTKDYWTEDGEGTKLQYRPGWKVAYS